MTLDVAAVRASFPALGLGVAHFDGPGGSQTPQVVAEAVARAMTAGVANRGTVTEAERRAEEIVGGARSAMADLLGCDPSGVVFGRSMTQLTYDVARALAKQWGPGTTLWSPGSTTTATSGRGCRPAEAVGATVRWAEFDKETGELPVDGVSSLLTDRTRVVAVTGASNLLGTRPDVAAIAEDAHEAGSLVYVDGVHLTPHAAVDVPSSVPTSSRARPTSSSARTTASWSPTRRCSRRCTPTSCCRPAMPCRSGTSSARSPTS